MHVLSRFYIWVDPLFIGHWLSSREEEKKGGPWIFGLQGWNGKSCYAIGSMVNMRIFVREDETLIYFHGKISMFHLPWQISSMLTKSKPRWRILTSWQYSPPNGPNLTPTPLRIKPSYSSRYDISTYCPIDHNLVENTISFLLKLGLGKGNLTNCVKFYLTV